MNLRLFDGGVHGRMINDHRCFKSRLSCVLLVLAISVAAPAATDSGTFANGLTVRVETTAGVPRLLVKGQPVRARMFFGGPASAPVRIQSGGNAIEFEFTAHRDALRTGTLHFRFGPLPGDVFLDNIRIQDLTLGQDVTPVSDFESGANSFSAEWTDWPQGAANTVGTVSVESAIGFRGSAGLHVAIRKPADGKWPDWHMYHLPNLNLVKGNRYRVSFWARAEPARDLTVALYRPGDSFVRLGGPPGPFAAQITMAAAVGVSLVTFPVPMPWPLPGASADWSATDEVCEEVLRANPDALLLPRFSADPPDWWRSMFPDEVMTWEDGSRQQQAVVASPRYRRDAAECVAALVEHLEEKFGERLAGYHPCGQNTGEWFYQNTWEKLLNGYAPADVLAWRAWLQARYPTDSALRQSWQQPLATLVGAAVPSPAERRAAPTGMLHDPATQQRLIDFAEFQQQAMADLVCELAHAARIASRGKKLVVFFYGYLFEFGPVRLAPTTSGHYGLRRVLESPDIDLLCSPVSYFDRGLGGSAPAMTAAESVGLAGKMWLCEDDTRTYLGSGDFPGQVDGAKDLGETQTMLIRNVAQAATRNLGTWWMDLGMTGWFADPRMWAEMKRLDPVDRIFLNRPWPYRPEVAAIIDEASMLLTSANAWKVTEPGIYEVRRPLGRMGAPYGQYLLEDVLRGRVHAKLNVFLNAWRLSRLQRTALLTNTRRTCCIWCYAPGMYEGNHSAPEAMRELTGFRLVPATPVKAWATPTERGRQLGIQTAFGVAEPVTPLFAAADANPSETLATYPDGTVAIALRKRERGWSLFVGVPGLTSELLRLGAEKAGVHLFTRSECNVYANGPILALHAAQDGAVRLDTGKRGAIYDALTGDFIADGPQLELSLKKGDTRVLRQ